MQYAEMKIREDVKYDRNNFWIRPDGASALIGLTEYGQWVIGDILYLELDPEGKAEAKGDRFGSIESGKWVGSLISPVSGRILQRNPVVLENPNKVNSSPYDEGWLIKVELETNDELGTFLDGEEYRSFVKEQMDREL